MFGAPLGFTVVVAWEQFSSAETHVANEASTLTTMYRQTVAMPAPEQTQLRELLRTYTKAAEGPEWAKQESGGGTSDVARAAITEMYRVLGSQPPGEASSQANGEFFGQLTVLTSERNTRVLDAKPRIPWLLWCGLILVLWYSSPSWAPCDSRADAVMPCWRARSPFFSAYCSTSSSASTIPSGAN